MFKKNLKQDMKRAKEIEEFEVITLDLEKTLLLLTIPTKFVYNWKRHFLCLGRRHRRVIAQEVGSCLKKRHYSASFVGTFMWWPNQEYQYNLDAEGYFLTSTFLHCSFFKSITFLQNDAEFSDVDHALKMQQHTYMPVDYINVMRTCREKTPFVVTLIVTNDFIGCSEMEKNTVNQKVDTTGNKIKWMDICKIMLKKDNTFKMMPRTFYHSLTADEHIIDDIEGFNGVGAFEEHINDKLKR
ncbi:hypothetical protein PR048_012474 [Dryococelus australis]|uniref:Uncharacterized protein n=1 Tax=Dryococelus australis TaxID=614101 RepID=A0ABQ9HPS0_9NEOP|nr:hypothetical protein PR048_012474 [Dryococelus australis]